MGMAVPELAHVPASHLENACATGSAALYSALDFVQSGRGRIALVIGVEKMTTIPPVAAAALMIRSKLRVPRKDITAPVSPVFLAILRKVISRNSVITPMRWR